MIDTKGNVRPGRPRRGREVVEYQKVKADIIEMLDIEIPDREIAARLGLSRSGFYDLKKRILKEIVSSDIAQNVAAREFMRLDRQMRKLIKHIDDSYETGAIDPALLTAFTNMSRRIADLVGANAAIAITVDNGEDPAATKQRQDHELNMAKELTRFYELQDRLRGDHAIGSGMTREERDREWSNLQAALPPGSEVQREDVGLDDDDEIIDAVEVIEVDTADEDEWFEGEQVEIERPNREARAKAVRECASGTGDQETPGRWVNGKFISWWHDKGDNDPEVYTWDTAFLDDEVWPRPDELTDG